MESSERMSASECLQHPWLSGADIYIGDSPYYPRCECDDDCSDHLFFFPNIPSQYVIQIFTTYFFLNIGNIFHPHIGNMFCLYLDLFYRWFGQLYLKLNFDNYIWNYTWRNIFEIIFGQLYFSDVLHELETTWMRRCLARRRCNWLSWWSMWRWS